MQMVSHVFLILWWNVDLIGNAEDMDVHNYDTLVIVESMKNTGECMSGLFCAIWVCCWGVLFSGCIMVLESWKGNLLQ